jgi:hypothetical protein
MATPRSTQLTFRFQPKLCLDFRGGEMITDPGLLLLRELDERLRLTGALDRAVEDTRDTRYVEHPVGDLLRQRIYQIAAGYEDAVDANLLRHGSKLRRWAGQEILLDVDSTDDPTHGHRQLPLFHGKYDTYMYHPLLIFEGHTGHLLSSRLRPGTAGDARGLVPQLRRLLPRLRQAFPGAPISLRADAGFTSPELRDFLEREGVTYLLGIPQYERLLASAPGGLLVGLLVGSTFTIALENVAVGAEN